MKMSFYHLAGCIFLFLLPAESSDGNTRQWSFTFPESIKVLKNADVTIPCNFTAPDNHSEVNLIWFKYDFSSYPQIFNSKDPSQVITEYRGRTSLVNGTNSCTLRIKDVTKTDEFYPGISEKINSFHLNNRQTVEVKVTGCSEDNSCVKWKFDIPSFIYALEGSCVDIPCTFTHPEDAKDFNFFWYSGQNIIFNNKTPSDVADEYKGRTFLTGNTENDCSLRIINVEKKEDYFPGINRDINSHKLKKFPQKVEVNIREEPPKILITGTENMSDKKTINISCSVNHTCPSFPPTIKWSITGHPIQERHTDLGFVGKWTMESIMTYTASYAEDKTDLGCEATFLNNKTSFKSITLDIKYSPENVTISVDGNKNTLKEDDVTLISDSRANPIYFAFIGIIAFPLLMGIIYFYWRKKISPIPERPQQPSQSTYAELQRRENQDEYSTLALPPGDTYTALMQHEHVDAYSTIKPAPHGGSNTQGRELSKDTEYENLHHKI